MDHGRILALDSPRSLIASLKGDHVVEFQVRNPRDNQPVTLLELGLNQLAGIEEAREEADAFCLSVGEPHRVIPELLNRLQTQSLELTALTTRQASLEDVFVSLTGRHLDDKDD